jgi:iron complex outermembrane receptor protein
MSESKRKKRLGGPACIGIVLALSLIGFHSIVRGEAVRPNAGPPRTLAELSLEELMNVEILTFSESPQRWFDIPAAVYVITQEDIRRSGVTSIPEALRMAPGVEVSRRSANSWVVGIRGFTSLTGSLSPSLLVLIDGRSVYSPLFAGVFWDVQDVLLEDVERIEVIRGPGGTLWGANAVNGVINIITKRSRATQGGLFTLGGGTEERAFGAARYGGRIGERLHYRFYEKFFDRDAGFHSNGDDFDDWRTAQTGFRVDLDLPNRDDLTLSGDLYIGRVGQVTNLTAYAPPFTQTIHNDAAVSGGNLLLRFHHLQSERSDWAFKAYYDRTNRRTASFQDSLDTVDLDLRNLVRTSAGPELTWGVGYRLTSDEFVGVPTIAFNPPKRTDSLYGGFVQGRIPLIGARLFLTLGSKFEHNDYSGFEVQPSGRLLWKVARGQTVWTAVTRAVRTPSRLEQDAALTALSDPTTTPPTFIRIVGSPSVDAERLLAYEIGYRSHPIPRLSVEATAFYNQYFHLLSLEPGGSINESSPDRVIDLLVFGNEFKGHTYGVELMSDYRFREEWGVNVIYSFLQVRLSPSASITDPFDIKSSTEGTNPLHQAGLRSYLTIGRDMDLDALFRYVDTLPSQSIDAYYSLDLRVGWRPTGGIELSLVAQNLLDNHHPEFGGGAAGLTEIQRGVYGKATARW